jgi:hypothetical protein
MSYLTEAFKALNKLEEETFDVSADGVKKLEDFLNDNDYVEDEIQIIDDNAEDFDELQKDYIGNVILDCNVCHSKIYKDEADITIDEESENANVGEQCPYCYSEDGFKVIGRIVPMNKEGSEDSAGLNESTKVFDKSSSGEENSSLLHLQDLFEKRLKEEFSDIKLDGIRSGVHYTLGNLTITTYIKKEKDCVLVHLSDYSSGSFEFAGIVELHDKSDVETAIQKIKEIVRDKDDKSLDESVNLATKENTIAGVLADNMSKLKDITDVNELRNKAIEVVENSNISDKPAVAKFKRVLFTKKSLIALLSTIATYMTGIKTLKEHFGLKTLKEDLGDDIEKYQEWVDYDMKRYGKISEQTNKEVKEAGLQIVKDKYGDYEVISGPYKEGLEESVEKVEVKTEESTTKVETEEDGSVKVTTEPAEKCEVEEKEEVIEPLTDEEKFDIEEGSDTDTDVEAEDFDEESFEELGESYLKEMYENVKSFKTTSKKMSGNTVIVEGLITFDTGKKAKTSFKFKSADCKDGSCRMLGENLSITKTPNAFVLNGRVDGKKFINETLSYSYRAKNEQGKQHRYNGTVSGGVK